MNTTKSEENRYLQKAEKSANRALFNQIKIEQLKNRLAAVISKYEEIFQKLAGHKVISLAAIGAHLVAAILAGLNIGPILFSAEKEIGQLASGEDYARVLFPIIMIFFLSLAIGFLISQINFRRHELRPQSIRFSVSYLLYSLGALIIYFGLLSHIIDMGINAAGPEHLLKVQLVLWLSIVELLIGIFAHRGWTVAYAHCTRWNINRKIYRNQRAYLHNRQSCERNYRYYQQITAPEEFVMTPGIEKVLGEKML